jgi:hypothetical protein
MPARGRDADAPVVGAISTAKGSKRKVSALFKFKVSALVYVSSHAVTGRLACLTVMPAFVITNVTPAPE